MKSKGLRVQGSGQKMNNMLDVNNVTKKYRKGAETFIALDNISFTVEKGDFFTVIGHSGSGKSTLLNIIGGLIHPDSGKVFYDDLDLYNFTRDELDNYRKTRVGFVFQQFHLMPYLTVLENIRMACREKRHYDRIDTYLEECSLKGQRNKYPSELSVGEKQRTAFIRAIIPEPEILLADEPTGNLDPANSEVLLNLIRDFHSKGGTVLLVSHDSAATEYSTRTLTLEKGRIIS